LTIQIVYIGTIFNAPTLSGGYQETKLTCKNPYSYRYCSMFLHSA